MWALGLIAGALVGASIAQSTGAFVGGVLGLIAGLVVGSQRQSSAKRIDAIEQRMQGLEAQVQALLERGVAAGASVDAAAGATLQTPQLTAAADIVSGADAPTVLSSDPDAVVGAAGVESASPAPTTGDTSPPPTLPVPPAPNPRPAWLAWIVGGNTLARIGVLLLFIGVGFLLKYASEHVHVPIETRLAGVAAGAVALLVVGWRLRFRRDAYAMILQGGAVGLLYLTVFAALRIYAVLPAWATIILLLLIAALSSSLAVLQDAIALAAIGIVGGFLAPILTSTNSGDHVLLFSYYALLNAAIFGIAWFKSWRSLNLLGFVFTFVVGVLWGVTKYRASDFSTTEPFLILFFLFYVAIAVLYAIRRTVELRSPVDATLVFGTPLVAAALQSALVRDMPFGMALSALALAALYIVLARVLFSRLGEGMRLPAESFLGLGIVFATLAIPLALDARWTSASWALEGAAMLWAGLRQRRWPLRAFGMLLQLAAGIAFAGGIVRWTTGASTGIPVLNSDFIGAAVLGLAGLYSAWLLWRERADLRPFEQPASAVLFAWGCIWWLVAGTREIVRWAPADLQTAGVVAFLALAAAIFAVAAQRLSWRMARLPAVALLPLLLVIALRAIAGPVAVGTHLFAHGGFVAWIFALIVQLALLRWFERAAVPDVAPSPWAGLWHAGTAWLALLVGAHELAWVGRGVGVGDSDGVWTVAPWGLVPALGLLAITHWNASTAWPIAAYRRSYVLTASVPIALALAIWTLKANVGGDGDPVPLPYLPLLNPLDLTQALVFGAVGLWLLTLRRFDQTLFRNAQAAIVVVGSALVFVWINALVLRTIHFWFSVPYDLHSLWRSMLVQVSFSLLWSVIALVTMLVANRSRWRMAWLAGATLLGAVVVKLFLVDLGQAGGVERIVSFIGVGLLLLLIGYLAPVPPRVLEEAK